MPLSGGPRGPPFLTRALGVGAGRTKEGRATKGGEGRPKGKQSAAETAGARRSGQRARGGGRGSGVGSGSLPQAPPEVAGGGVGEGRSSGALGQRRPPAPSRPRGRVGGESSAGSRARSARRPLTFHLRLVLGLQPPLPAQLPVRGHGFRAAAPSSPTAPTRPRAGRARGPGALQPAPPPAPPRPAPPPARLGEGGGAGPGTGGQGLSGGVPRRPDPAAPSCWALGTHPGCVCPALSGRAARARVTASTWSSSWHPPAAAIVPPPPPPAEGCRVTTAKPHPSQHGHESRMPVGSATLAAPGPGRPGHQMEPTHPQSQP